MHLHTSMSAYSHSPYIHSYMRLWGYAYVCMIIPKYRPPAPPTNGLGSGPHVYPHFKVRVLSYPSPLSGVGWRVVGAFSLPGRLRSSVGLALPHPGLVHGEAP